jgi:putative FmdB family regulatory protein
MPIYQYVCPSCKCKFEVRQGFNDESKVSCPRCNTGARRIFLPVPIFFKGSGFYVTDSAKKSEIQDTPKEPKSEKKPESERKSESERKQGSEKKIESEKKSESEKKPESKPAAKTS